MPRGKKAKRKRKAQKKAERERRFFNPPETASVPSPVTVTTDDQYDSSYSEDEYTEITDKKEIMRELRKAPVGVPDNTSPAARPPVQVKNHRHIGIQADVDEDDESEEKVGAANSQLSALSSTEPPKSCAQQTDNPGVRVRVESTTEEESVDVEWIEDGDSSDSDESFEVRVQDIFPLIEYPPIDALTAVLEKIMNFKFDLKDVRESKSVSCQCYAGEGGKPSARVRYQEVRIRRVSHRIQRMRRFLELNSSDFRHLGDTRDTKNFEELYTTVQEEIRKRFAVAAEEICPCPLHRTKDEK